MLASLSNPHNFCVPTAGTDATVLAIPSYRPLHSTSVTIKFLLILGQLTSHFVDTNFLRTEEATKKEIEDENGQRMTLEEVIVRKGNIGCRMNPYVAPLPPPFPPINVMCMPGGG